MRGSFLTLAAFRTKTDHGDGKGLVLRAVRTIPEQGMRRDASSNYLKHVGRDRTDTS